MRKQSTEKEQSFKIRYISRQRWNYSCWWKAGQLLHKSNYKHPILLPKDEKLTTLIIWHHHKMDTYGGRSITLNQIRSSGYWIVGANVTVRNFIFRYVDCRRLRGRFGEQKMANLPACRLTETAPFTYCGLDIFGSFIVKQRRSKVKRCGTMFSWIASRAVHIEVTLYLDTFSFILALRPLRRYQINIPL